VASVFADDRIVTTPPEMTVKPVPSHAFDVVFAIVIAMAAATVIGPDEDSAAGVSVEPESLPPLDEAWLSAPARSVST
jgi:hypothetical protein